MIKLFPDAGVKPLMVRHVSNTFNEWILFGKIWMTLKTVKRNYWKLS